MRLRTRPKRRNYPLRITILALLCTAWAFYELFPSCSALAK